MATQKKLTSAQKYQQHVARQRQRQAEFRKRKQDAGLRQVVIYVPADQYAAAKQGGLRPLQVIYGLSGTSVSAGIVSPDGQCNTAGLETLAKAAAMWGKNSGGGGGEKSTN